MASSIIHPCRLFAVQPSSDPAAKKNKKKTHQMWRKIKRLLSLQITDGENEPLVLSRQALLAVAAFSRGSEPLCLNAAGGGSEVEGRNEAPCRAAPLAVCFQRALCAIESVEKGGRTVCTLYTRGLSA